MAACNSAFPMPFPRISRGTYMPQMTALWCLFVFSSRLKPAMPTIVRSNAPKVTSSGDVLLLRSPCATPEIPRSRNSSKVEPNDSGSSRNARKRIFQNASASASVNMRTSIFLYPPFCEIGRTLPFLVCVEVVIYFISHGWVWWRTRLADLPFQGFTIQLWSNSLQPWAVSNACKIVSITGDPWRGRQCFFVACYDNDKVNATILLHPGREIT